MTSVTLGNASKPSIFELDLDLYVVHQCCEYGDYSLICCQAIVLTPNFINDLCDLGKCFKVIHIRT